MQRKQKVYRQLQTWKAVSSLASQLAQTGFRMYLVAGRLDSPPMGRSLAPRT
jgi:hypothetical protein